MTTFAQSDRTGFSPRPAAPGRWRRLIGISLMTGLLAATGCQSTDQSGPTGLASVEISGRTPDQIRATTVAVFQENGYTVAASGTTDMVFEQEASRMNRIAYGSWMEESPIYVRVKASVVPLAEGRYRLQCTVTKVRNKGDAFFEEDVKMASIRRRPYQDLLDAVAKRLK
jgi:hypothetical protein